MTWTRNGVSQPRQAPHNVADSYTFHGTYNPARNLDRITYNDLFTFGVVVAGNYGDGSLTIWGSMTMSDVPCSLGSPGC